jgi:hypothetical protein
MCDDISLRLSQMMLLEVLQSKRLPPKDKVVKCDSVHLPSSTFETYCRS